MIQAESCLPEQPPTLRKVEATVDDSCPPQFGVCLTTSASLDLEHNLRATSRWMKEAWTRCGQIDGGSDGGVDGGL